MRHAQGYATVIGPDGTRECDTFTCAHCNRICHVPANLKIEQRGDFCRSCMRLICLQCAAKRVCTPFLKKLERFEAREMARRSYV